MSIITASADREVEFGPLDMCDSDSDDGQDDRQMSASSKAGKFVRVIGAVVLSVVLAGAAALGGIPSHTQIAEEEHFISESHFSQSCSWKCNHKFWGKGDEADYSKCCEGCPGSTCTFPCTDACRQKREKALLKCTGEADCEQTTHDEHGQCCTRCPGSVCVVSASEDVAAVQSEGSDASEGAEGLKEVAKTCGGDAMGAACKFPFEYHGVEYTACTTVDLGTPWCYVEEEGKWGSCNCPTA